MPKTLEAKRTIVATHEQVVQVDDLTAGINLRVSPTLLSPEQSRQCLNFSLDEPGALTVRRGYTQYSSASFGSSRAQGGQRIYLSSQTFTLVAHNSTVNRVTDAGVFSSALSGMSTNQIYFPHDRDFVVALDGSSRVQKSTDGSTWTKFGIVAPSTVVVLSTLSSGACSSGEYEFAVSFKDRSLSYESNVSSRSTITLTGTTGAFHLTAGSSFADNDAQIDAYVWYGRDITAGETVLRKISSGTASTYRVTDTNWTANAEAPTNHDVLGGAVFGVVWKNRWWFVDPNQSNRLRFSEIFLPQAVPGTFYVDIPFERGDDIAAVQPLGDVLYVFGQSKAFAVIGQTSLDFEVRPSAGVISGALGFRATATVEQGVVHASAEGVHIFDGATDKLLTHNIDPAWRDYIASASAAELEKTPIVYEFRHKALRVAVTRRYPSSAAGEWELNLDRTRLGGHEAWVPTDRKIGGYILFDGNEATVGQRGELVTWSDTTGLLFKESTGASANSSNITATYEGPTLTLGLHRARVNGLHVEYEPNSGSLTSETVTDGVSQGSISLGIGAGLSLYGTALYGTGTYAGTGRRKAYTPQPISAEGRTVTHTLTYTGQARFRVFTYAYDIRPEPKIRFFSE